ncbi:MAG: HIT domain-containing protein [Clostridia bacterium]|nr:HIT domain-containing protein [Oscillospiraceae bacterium]MBQ7033152.1 HIT domain-containing protein [Clostridia bacterium]
MEGCIFCKIANGEQPCLKVYEDKYTIAFMDIAGDVDGHILVIPQKHCKNILDCDYETLNAVINTVKRVSNHLVDACGYDGVDIMSANDESAGQSLPHFHVHIIPRAYNDGLGGKGEWPHFPGAKHELESIYKKVCMV